MDISIITPTFNRSDCIIRCLESVSSQLSGLSSDIHIEHIVVDDGSTDNTLDLIKHYAATHTHVRLICFDHNRGVNAARNAAIKQAIYSWCLILDSDDCLDSGAINNITQTIERHPGYRSYMFTVDDRIEDMAAYGNSCEFNFEDFLLGRISGDFAHILDRQLLLDHPFNEELRIYEGIFFLCFFKDAKRMFFSNIITHLRERDRNDSVTLTMIRFNDAVITRKLLSAKIQLDLFEKDYIAAGHPDAINKLNFEIADNFVLLGDYHSAMQAVKNAGMSLKVIILRGIIIMRSGRLYKWALQKYLSIKHKRPQLGIQ